MAEVSAPHHGDGRTYAGVCFCCGVKVAGPIARSRPGPYLASEDPFGAGPRRRVVLIVNEYGAPHEIPLHRPER